MAEAGPPAVVKILCDNTVPKEIFWWMLSHFAIEHIQQYKHNPNYLSSVEIKVPQQNTSADLKSVIAKAEAVLLNVPVAFLKEALTTVTAEDLKGKKIISAIKGIVPDENLIYRGIYEPKIRYSFAGDCAFSGAAVNCLNQSN